VDKHYDYRICRKCGKCECSGEDGYYEIDFDDLQGAVAREEEKEMKEKMEKQTSRSKALRFLKERGSK
jgi:hypothetical protein